MRCPENAVIQTSKRLTGIALRQTAGSWATTSCWLPTMHSRISFKSATPV